MAEGANLLQYLLKYGPIHSFLIILTDFTHNYLYS